MQAPADRDLELILRASEAPIYNTAAVARRCAIPAPTLRAWERRYGFPEPRRGPSNRRLYAERDVLAIRWLQDRIAEGLTISAALAFLRERLDRRPSPAPALAVPGRSSTSPSMLALQLERALLGFDAARAAAILGEAFGLWPLEQVCLEVIQPMLRAIGDGWQCDTIDVAQEHFASGFIRQRLAALLELSNAPGRARTVIAACAPDEWHELGLLMVALFLARRGWHVVYLGASLPPDDLGRGLARLRPTAIVFSASSEQSAGAVAAIVRRLDAGPPPRPLLGYGGSVFEQHPALRDAVPGVYLGPDAATAAARLDQLLAANSA